MRTNKLPSLVDVENGLSNETSSDPDSTPTMPKQGVHKETLWDIELDKELAESEGEHSFDFTFPNID